MSAVIAIEPSDRPRPVAVAVEDDGFERLRLASILERLGYDVRVASDGAEALAVLAGCTPEVVVTDWQLPALSGLDLCRSLSSANAANRPYTVLVTARGEVRDLVEGLDAGADDFLAKPYRAEELTARLRSGQRLLQLRRSLLERTALLEQALRHQDQARETVGSELRAAARLQLQLLDRATRPLPGMTMAHFFRPTNQVGGDVFGAIELGCNRVGFFHIDATGHGIAAALHVFSIATALLGLRGRHQEFADPAAWVTEFNRIALDLGLELGCSLVVGWLDVRSLHGRLCQAGHPHPLAVGIDGGGVRRLGLGALPVGSLDGLRYVATDFALAPRERLVLYSDGVTDCVDALGMAFGQDRLERALADCAGLDLASCVQSVGRALDTWRDVALPTDDLSLLVLEPSGALNP